MDQAVSLDFFVKLVRKYWCAIIFCTLTGILVASFITFRLMQPQYQSSVQILVSRHSNDAATQYNNQQADVQMITTYKELITNPVILNPVINNLKEAYDYTYTLDGLQKAVTVTNTQNSQVFSINVTNPNRNQSARIANQIAKDFKVKVKEIIKVNNVTIVSPAVPSKLPISPKKVLNLIVGLITGVLLGFIYAIVRTLTDRRVQGLEYLTSELALPVLGQVSHQHQTHKHHVIQQVEKLKNDAMYNTGKRGTRVANKRV